MTTTDSTRSTHRSTTTLLAAGVGACAVLLALAWLLQSVDTCLSTSEHQSEQNRMIDAAVQAVLSTYPPAVVRKVWAERDGKRSEEEPKAGDPVQAYSLHKPAQPIPYANSTAFLQQNNGCCSAVAIRSVEEGKPSRLKVLTGGDASYIRLVYAVRYTDSRQRLVEVKYEEFVGFSRCGRVSRSAGRVISSER